MQPTAKEGDPDTTSPAGACVAPESKQFGSFTLSTDVALPTLPDAVSSGTTCLTVSWNPSASRGEAALLHQWVDDATTVLSLFGQGPDFWLEVPGVAEFLIQVEALRVSVVAEPGDVDDASLEHQLVDQILPRMLDQLGELMVHASAVEIDGRSCLFLGASGAGKSTLAGLLHRRGHRVFSDDCVQVVGDDGTWRALATYPSLRLLDDSLGELFPDLPDTTLVSDYSSKRRLPFGPRGQAMPARIDAIYVIDEPRSEDAGFAISPIGAAHACLSLVKHSFRLDMTDRLATFRHLQRCSAVARDVPAFQFDYPRDYARHDELADRIRAHLASLPVGTEA